MLVGYGDHTGCCDRERENICVVFSLLLLNFTGVSNSESMGLHGQEQLLDAFSAHVKSVLLDEETRDIFKKICDLDDLLGLGEDFVLHKILFQDSRTPGSLCDSSIDILQLGKSSVLQLKLSPTNLVVAGSIILASIAVVTGVIGYVCEVSLKILSTSRADSSHALLILHTFAYICGEEYFTTSNYLAAMKAVKIWVTSVEGSLADNDNMCLQQEDATWLQFSPCDNCPFSEASVCLEDVSSELFEELQECMKCATDSSYPSEVESLPGSLGVVLSSLKLIAAKMSWDGVCNNVITKVFKMLESFEKETVQVPRRQPRSKNRNTILTEVVLFLGDLGRFGVEASGYDDFGVLQMKRQLLGILCQTSASKCDDLQLAVIYALIGLYPNDHKIQNHAEISSQFGNSASIPTAPSVMADIISSVGRERTTYLLSLM